MFNCVYSGRGYVLERKKVLLRSERIKCVVVNGIKYENDSYKDPSDKMKLDENDKQSEGMK